MRGIENNPIRDAWLITDKATQNMSKHPFGKVDPRPMELKGLLRRRDSASIETALLTSTLGFRFPYPSRRVDSLYFDSHDFRAIERSLSESSIRQKTRLRWYDSKTLP